MSKRRIRKNDNQNNKERKPKQKIMKKKRNVHKKEELEKSIFDFIQNEEKYTKECFDIESEYYSKMIDILEKSKSRGINKEFGYELHHKIPRSFFKKKGMIVVNKNNLYKLTYSEHFMVHFYAYKCATKFMKSSMCMAMIQMKRVCSKNTNEYDTIEMSKIFESIKLELYNTRKKSWDIKTYQTKKQQLEEKTNGKFKLLSCKTLNDLSQSRVELVFQCKKCGKIYTIRQGIHFLQNAENFKCECERGFRENVNGLWFGINKYTKKAEWSISNFSYTPSMKERGSFITKNDLIRYKELPSSWCKMSLMDIQPQGYVWNNLDENRKYKVQRELNIQIDDNAKEFVNAIWEEKTISNNFIYKVSHHTDEFYFKYLGLKPRDFLPKVNQKATYKIIGFDEELTINEWEKIFGITWSNICNKYKVFKTNRLDDLLVNLYKLRIQNPLYYNVMMDVIPYAIENNINSLECEELILDAYLYCLGYSNKDIDSIVNELEKENDEYIKFVKGD